MNPHTPLPPCRWRGPLDQGHFLCASERYLIPPNRVSPEFCRGCAVADHPIKPNATRSLPCLHLGGPVVEPMFSCTVHSQCLPRATVQIANQTQVCSSCPDYVSRRPFDPDSGTMRQRADAYLEGLTAYPKGRYHGRGIVIAGGGERYLPSLYVTIRALRYSGCNLPIEVWYLGRNDEMPKDRQELLAPYNVKCIDADIVRLQYPARRLNGWELKVFATLHSSFEEVLFLDADCYPCRNPMLLFDLPDYLEAGAIFWPDMATFDGRLKWPAFGMTDPLRPGSVESGQYLINKERCWPALNLAWFYNDHSDYYYRHCYGDKHTFEVAWTRCGPPFVMWNPNAVWSDPAYVHPGPDGLPLFIHRCADKFRFGQQGYITHQNHNAPVFHANLPLETEAWVWMADLASFLGIDFMPPKPTP